MPDKDGNVLPPLPDDSFDGEKCSVEIKKEKCAQIPELVDNTHIRCKRCGAGWSGPQIERLYEAWTK